MGHGVVILQEHWLWPFELAKLRSVSDKINYHAVSDPRLDENSELSRGCGGVAILWSNDLIVERIPYPGNRRLCCSKVHLMEDTYLHIIGVYLPSNGYTEEYRTCLNDLEELLSGLPHTQPTMIVGDFNAHIAAVGCNTVSNSQGQALKELVCRNNLFLAPHDNGPGYTYCCGQTRTTVDYILVNQCASYLMTTSGVLVDHPLNTSDHLPVHAVMAVIPSKTRNDSLDNPRVNWGEAAKDLGRIKEYQCAVDGLIRPLIGNTYDNITQIEQEINLVMTGIRNSATQILPLYQKEHSSGNRFHDTELQRLCNSSKQLWAEWVAAGSPMTGQVYEKKNSLKRAVRRRINTLEASKERKNIQLRDMQFKNHHPKRFSKAKPSSVCMKLHVNGQTITNKSEIIHAWEDHFSLLSKSRISNACDVKAMQNEVASLSSASHSREDYVFDVEFEAEEVLNAVSKLHNGKVAGPDGILGEHLKYGGSLLGTWIMQIFNAILLLECVPLCFKQVNITPIYKGKGKDPRDPNSYRGIGVSNILSKLFESLTLTRMMPELESKGFPSIQQTAYQRGVSCEDATFAAFETIAYLTRSGNTVFQTFYDLEKAFDSIEYCVLLKHLFSKGIHGKCWRIIQSFYDKPRGHVKVNGCLSPSFVIGRGVRQGSVLSPTLFLVVIDSLLEKLKGAYAGITLDGLYLGSLGHADDIRSLTCDMKSSNTQAAIIDEFLTENLLQMNTEKCELVIHSHGSIPENAQVKVGSTDLKPSTASKCLGVWWTPDLCSTKAVAENISKARKAFFSFGCIGAFQGKLNPLSSRSVVEACVMPVLLFGAESWYLTDSVLDDLECFQCTLGRRILKLSRFHSNTSVLIGLDWPSVRARVLIRKLSYLTRVFVADNDKLSSQILKSFAERDISNLSIVEQCRYLEGVYGTDFTGEILDSRLSRRDLQKAILAADKAFRLKDCDTHQSLKHITGPGIPSELSWLKIWDMALDHGVRGTKAALSLFSALSRPFFGNRLCPHCAQPIDQESTYLEHLVESHSELQLGTMEEITEALASATPVLIQIGKRLLSLYSPTV